VRLVSAAALARSPRLRDALTMRAGAPVRTVCAFSYRGSYTPDAVERPFGTPVSGAGPYPYAVVIVSMPANELLGTALLEHQPMPFRHNL
jgi:hypothetical protein